MSRRDATTGLIISHHSPSKKTAMKKPGVHRMSHQKSKLRSDLKLKSSSAPSSIRTLQNCISLRGKRGNQSGVFGGFIEKSKLNKKIENEVTRHISEKIFGDETKDSKSKPSQDEQEPLYKKVDSVKAPSKSSHDKEISELPKDKTEETTKLTQVFM